MSQETLLKEHGFSIQIKPVGSSCNINCEYCYVKQFRKEKTHIMPDDILENIISQCLAYSPKPTFSWHGGEPTLAGIDFFQKAMDLIEKHKNHGQIVRNMIQTNAINISPELARLFYEYQFGVGISLDGSEDVHGIHRCDLEQKNTFKKVMYGVETLRQVGINPSVIITVTEKTLPYAIQTFHFLNRQGFTSIKYSPVYDSLSDSFSIGANEWFEYLRKVFLEWVELGNQGIRVCDLDEVMIWLQRKKLNVCSSNQSCLMWISIDPNGNLYPCEYLRYKHAYGNILNIGLNEITETKSYKQFAELFLTPPIKCKSCDFYTLCGNGCPATRILGNKMSPKGVYVYCQERRNLFDFIKTTFEGILEKSFE